MNHDQDFNALAGQYYQQARELSQAQRAEEAIRCLRSALYYDPTLRPAYVALAEQFLSLNMAGQAMHAVKMAMDRFGANPTETGLYDLARNALRAIHQVAAGQKTVHGFSVVKYFGAGWEGAVYLVKDSRKTKWIVKAFHPGEIRQINYEGLGGVQRNSLPCCRPDLEALAARSHQKATIDTIYPLELVDVDGRMVGIRCPYEPLWKLDAEMVSHPSIKMTLLATFLKLQAFLIKECRLLLSDPINGFMINVHGDLKYIDYGRSIIPIDDFRCGDDCLDAVCFFKFLFHVIDPPGPVKKTMQGLYYPSRHNRALLTALISEIKGYPQLKPILHDLDNDHLERFHDAGFYETLSRRFMEKVSNFGKNYFSYRSIIKQFAHRVSD